MKKVFTFLSLLAFSFQLANAQTAPDFTFTDAEGEEHNLQANLDAGKIVMLDFFFVNCPPCQDSAPELVSIAQDYANTNLVMWSLSDRDNNSAIQGFEEEYGLTFPAGGTEGGANDVIDLYADNFQFTGFPTISVVCPNGNITWDIWPYTPGAQEWRDAIEACGVELVKVDEIASLNTASLTPNPAKETSRLSLDFTEVNQLTIGLFNAQGAKMTDVFQGRLGTGTHSLDVDINNLPAGAYWVRITNEAGQTKSLPLQKF